MEKKFEAPELIIVLFTSDDIITDSLPGDDTGDENEW